MRSARISTVLFTVALAACAGYPPPVPVSGSASDLGALAGQWDGEYSSVETGRSGSITFRLVAGTDSAFGDVIMVPRGQAQAIRPAPREGPQAAGMAGPQPEALTIRFVRVTGGTVSGVLAPYTDPECGCIVRTTFTGRLAGSRIEGDFTSVHLDHNVTRRGRWSAERRR